MPETSDEFEERWLNNLRKTIGPGPGPSSFEIPPNITVESSASALRFRGSATAITGLESEFAKLARAESGTEIHINGWVFRISDEIPQSAVPTTIVLPWHAWWMAGHLFTDVAYGYYDSRFDFSDVGYVGLIADDESHVPWPQPDIGVILEGAPLERRG